MELKGQVESIVFYNEDNGYTVLEIETTHGDEVGAQDEGDTCIPVADYN